MVALCRERFDTEHRFLHKNGGSTSSFLSYLDEYHNSSECMYTRVNLFLSG